MYDEANDFKKVLDRKEIDKMIEENNLYVCGKKVLDIGTGHGHHLKYLTELGAEVLGYDVIDYFDYGEYCFINDRVENLPEIYYGLFDIVIQFRYQSDISTIKTAAQALNPNGIYLVTCVDGELGCVNNNGISIYWDSKVTQALLQYFKELQFKKAYLGGIECVASKPKALSLNK